MQMLIFLLADMAEEQFGHPRHRTLSCGRLVVKTGACCFPAACWENYSGQHVDSPDGWIDPQLPLGLTACISTYIHRDGIDAMHASAAFELKLRC
jgi:hypothetical protein